LPFARGVDRLAENARSLLRRMKARRVLRFEEVEIELRLALKVPRAVELFVFRAR
jgi:hypothetical protein